MTTQNHSLDASRFISLLLLTTLSSIASASSIAAPPTDTRQKVLDYSDLDLNSMSGVRRVYARIRKAAEAVCGDQQVIGSRIT
jgi:UrcA family protein